MDKIATFSWDMKNLLESKDKFHKLCDITSQTDEPKQMGFINELLQNIVDIFENLQIPMENSEDEQKDRNINKIRIVVQCYNYLLLNTCFPSQQTFTRNFLYGHIVNVWPPISPYLFIQIIWRLEYDEVLVESLQHVPLDLCVEILEATIDCLVVLVELENERAIFLIFSLISRIYCKCLWLDWNIHVLHDLKEFLHQLVAHFQKLVMVLFDKFNQSPHCDAEIYIQKKRKQRGTLLKRILHHTRLCMCKKLSSNVINPDVTYKADMYRLTRGTSDIYYVYTNYGINPVMIMLDQQLVMLILKQIQEIDHREYLDWAEIKDEKNPMISLQYAVATECHNFMEYMKRDDFLVENDNLRQLLQQLINWSNFSILENTNRFGFTLQKLCDWYTTSSKPKYVRKLMKHYKEWDKSTLDFISAQMHLLKKKDIFFLLEYLHHVFANSLNVTERNQAYEWVLIMLYRVNMKDLFSIVLKYTKRHFQDNYLECMYDDEIFHDFIKNGNINIPDSKILRVLLLYVLLNAKKVLTILVKIVIKHIEYSPDIFIFTSGDLLLLQQFLCIKVDEGYNLLLVILKEVCFNNSEWCENEFYKFISEMLSHQVIKIDKLINYFCIPYLMTTDVAYNHNHILAGMKFIKTKLENYARKINYILLIIVLTKMMSLIRRDNKRTKKETDKMFSIVYQIVSNFPKYFATPITALHIKWKKFSEYNYIIGNWLEPIDYILTLRVIKELNVLDLIQNYKIRCFPIHQKLRIDARWKMRTNLTWKSIKRFTPCARINRESFIRHMMLHATMEEFQWFVYALIRYHYYLGWSSNLEAYENIMRIATEALQLTMVYCAMFPPNAFYELLYFLIKFCEKCAKLLPRIDHELSHEAICRILLKALLSLEPLMNNTQYSKSYSSFCIRVMIANKAYKDVKSYFCDVIAWIEICFNEFGGSTVSFEKENFESLNSLSITNSRTSTNKLLIMYQDYCFICECVAMLNTKTYGCTKDILLHEYS